MLKSMEFHRQKQNVKVCLQFALGEEGRGQRINAAVHHTNYPSHHLRAVSQEREERKHEIIKLTRN
jgi:hypothetical protein